MEKYRNECQSLKDSLRTREDELTRVKNETSQLQQQIEEQKETLKNNENGMLSSDIISNVIVSCDVIL